MFSAILLHLRLHCKRKIFFSRRQILLFYVVLSENGRAAYYEDGSPLEYTPEGGICSRYAAADGSLRYHVILMGNANPTEREAEGVIAGSLIGREIEVALPVLEPAIKRNISRIGTGRGICAGH